MENMELGTEELGRKGLNDTPLIRALSEAQVQLAYEFLSSIRVEANDYGIIAMGVSQAMNLALLDPVLKKQLYDTIMELRGLVRSGSLDGMLTDRHLEGAAAEMKRRNESLRDYNARLLRELATFLMLDLSQYANVKER